MIGPDSFLATAERLDLIKQIDSWVVTRAITMLAELEDAAPDIVLEVNLSGRSLEDRVLLAQIDYELRNASVAADRLIFEVTETAAVSSISQARRFGARLSEIGCRFALDDFGIGNGGLLYLKHLWFDYVKIAGEFVRNCRTDRTDQLVIESVVGMCRGMGKQTIAEFVGDDATATLLAELGVDLGQGYHLGRPQPIAVHLASPRV